MLRFSVGFAVALAVAFSVAHGSGDCDRMKRIFSSTASLHPCAWNACPTIPSKASGSCPDLVSAFKEAGSQYSCMFDDCKDSNPNPTPNPTPTSDPVVGIYLPNWFVYMKHYMGPTNLDANPSTNVGDPTESCCKSSLYFANQMRDKAPLLTHIYYAFYDLNDECRVSDRDPDASWYGASETSQPSWIKTPDGECEGLMNQLMSLKTEFPHLNLMLSIGGWTYSQNFYKCAATADKRDIMWKSFKFWMDSMDDKWGTTSGRLTGIDFDWEHPATNDGLVDGAWSEDDWKNYATLVAEFRQKAKAAGKDKMQITSAIGVGKTLTRLVTEFPDQAKKFCENVDHVNLMTYDLHGKWDPTTGHNAPFCSDSAHSNAKPDPTWKWSVVEVTKPLGQICGYAKLNLGIPNYAPAWTGIEDGGVNGLYQTSTQKDDTTKGFARWSTFSDSDKTLSSQGQIHYFDMVDILKKYSDFKVYTAYTCEDLGIKVPVNYVYSSQRKAFASFETLDVITAKVQWAKKIGMGGFFYWDASQDRNGETLNAGVQAWGGLTPRSKSGSPKCYDDNKPDFAVDPATGKELVPGCFTTDKSVVATPGSGCAVLGQQATAKCPGGKSYAVGGKRSWGAGSCVMPCSYSWGNGDDGLQAQDTVYFVCDLSELDNLTPSN